MPDERALRDEICEIGRRMYRNGFAAANDGNITARLDDRRVLCTPSLISKGFMTPDDLCVIDMEGEQLAGDRPRSSEALLHLEFYKGRPDVGAVVHCHPPAVSAFAVTDVPIPAGLMVEVEWHLGPIPVAPFGFPGGPGLPESVRPYVKDHHAVVMSNHGAVTGGAALIEAYFRAEILNAYCRTLILSKALGPLKRLGPQQMRRFLENKRRAGLPDPRYDLPDGDLLGPAPW